MGPEADGLDLMMKSARASATPKARSEPRNSRGRAAVLGAAGCEGSAGRAFGRPKSRFSGESDVRSWEEEWSDGRDDIVMLHGSRT